MVVPVLLGEQLAALVPAVHVVVADDVQGVQERRAWPRPPSAAMWSLPVVTGRVGSSRWKMSTSRRSTCAPVRRVLLADLVAGAPQDDRGVVAVAVDEVRDVPLGPLGEVAVVALGHLADGPLVEGLGHDEEAQAVAEVEELGRRRVVRGADGVRAHRLEHLEPALPDPLRHRRADRARRRGAG